MVYIGLLVGLFSGVLIGRDSWFFCAAVGTLLGWLIDRVNSLSAEVKKLDKRTAYVEKMAADPAAAFKSQAADTLGNAPSVPEPKAEAPMAPPITEVVASATLPDSLAVVPPQSLESAVIQSSPAVPSGTGYEPPPTEPNFIIKLLLGGNTVVRVGVVILFFGVAFLLKFAYEHSHVPVEVRLIGVSLSAMALLFFGWRLRNRRPGYALSLQGGGVGLLYLTIFAAFRLYSVLPPGPAFALLVLVAAFSALLAVWQDSLALAAAGVTGGFLAPILASTGQGSHVMLFSYYVVLNLGIAAVAWKKAWRVLNILGFVFTFVIGSRRMPLAVVEVGEDGRDPGGIPHEALGLEDGGCSVEEGARLAGRVSGDSTVAYAWAYAMALEGMPGARPSGMSPMSMERSSLGCHWSRSAFSRPLSGNLSLAPPGALSGSERFTWCLLQFFGSAPGKACDC